MSWDKPLFDKPNWIYSPALKENVFVRNLYGE